MTAKEFIDKCIAYFGGFHNDNVMKIIAKELRYIKPVDYKKIFLDLIRTLPAAFKPDYKAFRGSLTNCRIVFLDNEQREKVCHVCGTVNYSAGTSPTCPKCKFHPDDGDPEKYKTFWENWKAGKVEKVDVNKIIKDLAESKSVTE